MKNPETTTTKNILEILNADNCSENCEKFAEAFFDSIQSDDEPWRKIGRQMLYAIIINDVDAFCTAATGWSIDSLLVKAGLIPDTEGIFN